jgi:hypothetical protein
VGAFYGNLPHVENMYITDLYQYMSAVVLVKYVGRLDSVGRHGDGFSVNKEF